MIPPAAVTRKNCFPFGQWMLVVFNSAPLLHLSAQTAAAVPNEDNIYHILASYHLL